MTLTPFQIARYIPPGYDPDNCVGVLIEADNVPRVIRRDPFTATYTFTQGVGFPRPQIWLRQGNNWTHLEETAPLSGKVIIKLDPQYTYPRIYPTAELGNVTQLIQVSGLSDGFRYQTSSVNIRTESLPAIRNFRTSGKDHCIFRSNKIVGQFPNMPPTVGNNVPAGASMIRYDISSGVEELSNTLIFAPINEIGGAWESANGNLSLTVLVQQAVPTWWRIDYSQSIMARQMFPFNAYPITWASTDVVYTDDAVLADKSLLSVALSNHVSANPTTGEFQFEKKLMAKRSLDGAAYVPDSSATIIDTLPADAPIYPITLLLGDGVIILTDTRTFKYRSFNFGRTWEPLT